MKNLDVLAIGELAVDAFIRLENPEIHTEGTGKESTLCIPFATKIPYAFAEEIPAVANAGNAAVSASRLGLHSAIVACLGEDENGEKCLNSLKNDGVSTEFIHIEKDKKTNYHYILWFEKDRTILQKHSQFTHTLPDFGKDTLPKWIYLTSLGENSLPMHHAMGEYFTAHPDIKVAFQPGIFQIKFGTETLKDIYANTEAFCANVEEVQTILNKQSRDLKVLLKGIAHLGPKKVFITDGFDGAYAYDSSNEKFLFMPVYPHTPYERTGAGDAFFSTVVSCLSMGKTLEEALMWGPVNSQSVVQQVGAQKGLLTQEKLLDFLAKAPEDYKVREI